MTTTLHRVHELRAISRSPEGFLDSLADVGREATWQDDDFSCEPLHDALGAARRGPARFRREQRRDGPTHTGGPRLLASLRSDGQLKVG
jgi:hypothetical protein